jgi:hypothetical protein
MRGAFAQLAEKETLQTAALAVGGGALGALAAGVAVGAGVKPKTAAAVTLAGGAAGAYFLRGTPRVVALGAACAAGGQLALAYEIQRRAEKARTAQGTATLAAPELKALPPASPTVPPETATPEAPSAPPEKTRPAPRQGTEDDDEPDAWRNAWAVEPVEDADDEEEPVLYVDEEAIVLVDDEEPVLYADVIETDYELVQ